MLTDQEILYILQVLPSQWLYGAEMHAVYSQGLIYSTCRDHDWSCSACSHTVAWLHIWQSALHFVNIHCFHCILSHERGGFISTVAMACFVWHRVLHPVLQESEGPWAMKWDKTFNFHWLDACALCMLLFLGGELLVPLWGGSEPNEDGFLITVNRMRKPSAAIGVTEIFWGTSPMSMTLWSYIPAYSDMHLSKPSVMHHPYLKWEEKQLKRLEQSNPSQTCSYSHCLLLQHITSTGLFLYIIWGSWHWPKFAHTGSWWWHWWTELWKKCIVNMSDDDLQALVRFIGLTLCARLSGYCVLS